MFNGNACGKTRSRKAASSLSLSWREASCSRCGSSPTSSAVGSADTEGWIPPRMWNSGQTTVTEISGFGVYIDHVTVMLLFIASFLCLLINTFAIGYMNTDPINDNRNHRFYAEFVLFCSGMLGMVLADSFLWLFIFWELMYSVLLPADRVLLRTPERSLRCQEGVLDHPCRRRVPHGWLGHPLSALPPLRCGRPAPSTTPWCFTMATSSRWLPTTRACSLGLA